MPNKISFDLKEYKDFQKQLKQLGTPATQAIFYDAAEQTAVTLDQIARDTLPPPVRKQAAAPFWTKKQRRAWWASMHKIATGRRSELSKGWKHSLAGWKARYKDGKLILSGSYRRTNTLVKSLTWRISQRKGETLIEYGTNRDYAAWVIDSENQAKYHEGNWETLQAIIEKHEDKLSKTFFDTVGEKLSKLFGAKVE